MRSPAAARFGAVPPQAAVSARKSVFAVPVLPAAVQMRQDLFFLLPVQAVLVRQHPPYLSALPEILLLLSTAVFRIRFLPDSPILPEQTGWQE